MNKQGKGKIEWTDYTWSPVTGCLHNCKYCYAKRIYQRFNMDFTPTFHEKRIMQPYGVNIERKPLKIFVCSVADLFGDWVNPFWIKRILKVVKNNPKLTFQFLTKNPKRYSEFSFPKNCWLGATITGKEEPVEGHYKIKALKSKDNFKFISFEPLLNKIDMDLSGIDLVIVGAMTGPGSIIPKKEWIDSIKHQNIFYKNNIKKYL